MKRYSQQIFDMLIQRIFVKYTKNDSILALSFKDFGDVFGDVFILTARKCRKQGGLACR
jgi:hypothetical protein